LELCSQRALKNPPREDVGPSETARGGGPRGDRGFLTTGGPEHAAGIARALIEEVGAEKLKTGRPPFHLLITAGGDGTSLEALTELLEAKEDIRSSFAVLRLPLGTGNDGADAWELGEALRLIIEPSEISRQRSLRLVTSTPGKGPFPAFNILSVGIDAFVTHMTNRMKGRFPGDSYKLWVDIASLLYDRLYHVGEMDVRALDENGSLVKHFQGKPLLIAVGESGRRTYGSHKRILPDDRNVCLLKQMSLFRKLALKGLFNTGTHVNKPESILLNAHRIEFTGSCPILAQMDGETVLLEPGDFPAAIELSEPVIPILRLKESQGGIVRKFWRGEG
jgi:diacylglycerol kinase family enzyme